jgi:hypothetical protein
MLTAQEAAGIRFVLTDIDDTLTKDGKLLPEAYLALWKLKNSGYVVVPVTGRPAGWCDLIVRQWPVDAVIGENGALVYYLDNGILKTLYHPSVASGDFREKLEVIRQDVLARVPGTRVAKDQFTRMFDLAIDFNEEPPYLGYNTALEIKKICEEHGARAKISSIHVNTWYGDYDKLAMADYFFRLKYGINIREHDKAFIFCGDSPNDEPMFKFFPLSFAVANIKDFLSIIEYKPRFISDSKYGTGFAEIAEKIMLKKSGN